MEKTRIQKTAKMTNHQKMKRVLKKELKAQRGTNRNRKAS